jgi:hypothetical protein
MKTDERVRVRKPRAFYTIDHEIREYHSGDATYMSILYNKYKKYKEFLPIEEYLLRVTTEFTDKDGDRILVALTTEHLEILDGNLKSKFCAKLHSIHQLKKENGNRLAIYGYTVTKVRNLPKFPLFLGFWPLLTIFEGF